MYTGGLNRIDAMNVLQFPVQCGSSSETRTQWPQGGEMEISKPLRCTLSQTAILVPAATSAKHTSRVTTREGPVSINSLCLWPFDRRRPGRISLGWIH